MSDETTTAETTVAETPVSGIKAAEKLIGDHWAKKDAAKAAPTDEDADTDEEEAAPPKPQQPPKKKGETLVDSLKRERQARKAARAEADALKARIEALEKGAKAAPAQASALDRERWLEQLQEAGVDEAEALDQLQKRALANGGVPPAVQRLLDQYQKKTAALEAQLAELKNGLSSKEEAAAHEAGWRALAQEASRLDAYPELDGYEWAELEPIAEQAVHHLVARGQSSVTPQEVMGVVNAALKAQREQMEAKLAKRTAKASPPPPASKAQPPKKKAPPVDDLEPVTPSRKGKLRLPSDEEVMRRIQARQSM